MAKVQSRTRVIIITVGVTAGRGAITGHIINGVYGHIGHKTTSFQKPQKTAL